jgi:Acetyltransferase (GNAT) domain
MTSKAYEIEPLPAIEIPRWDDLIAPYANRTLFHRQTWLDYLKASQNISIRQWRVSDHGHLVGYFCGGLLRKGPFKILGSPLRGWGTNFMGPVGDASLSSSAFLGGLEELARREPLSMVELESRALDATALSAHRYEPVTAATFVVDITPGNTELMWRRLDSTRRNGILKAQRCGIVVEQAHDAAIADEFYDQYLEVMREKGSLPPYPRNRPKLLFHQLAGVGLLIALRARNANGEVVATGLFPHDDTTLYFWGGASFSEAYKTNANEYLHWTAMTLGAECGLRSYNMCGNGLFKKKFGGKLLEVQRWSKCYSRTARWGRQAYASLFNQRLKLQAKVQRAFSAPRA